MVTFILNKLLKLGVEERDKGLTFYCTQYLHTFHVAVIFLQPSLGSLFRFDVAVEIEQLSRCAAQYIAGKSRSDSRGF